MNKSWRWQTIAERLSESGWSWRHKAFRVRDGRRLHLAEACDADCKVHAVLAPAIAPAFIELEKSIKDAGE